MALDFAHGVSERYKRDVAAWDAIAFGTRWIHLDVAPATHKSRSASWLVEQRSAVQINQSNQLETLAPLALHLASQVVKVK